MSNLAPFNPSFNEGQTVTATATPATTQIGKGRKQLAITNTGSNIAYVRVGNGSRTASIADFPILAGTQIAISKFEDDDYLCYISAGGTSLHIIPGEGW